MLLENFRRKQEQLKQITEVLEAESQKAPHIEKLLAVKGVGLITVAGFLAEVGDVGRFDPPKQTQKPTGPELKENSSGKHKGAIFHQQTRTEESEEYPVSSGPAADTE